MEGERAKEMKRKAMEWKTKAEEAACPVVLLAGTSKNF
jgi:hypothetical protein